jgi:LemA protein
MTIPIVTLITIAVVVAAVVAGAVIACRIKVYNDLVTRKNKVKNSWGHIEAQMQRRFDLVPNLIETVKGFAIHERQILDNMTSVIDKYLAANTNQEKLAMDAQLTEYLQSLYNVTNHYPQLKSNANFLQMQTALTEIEEDISYARQFYNDAVTIYNNKIMTFPGNVVAEKYGFKEETLFEAVKEARAMPEIQMRYTTKNQCPVCGASVAAGDIDCKYCGSSLV